MSETIVDEKVYAPKEFKNELHIEEIKGIYVPFWMFDIRYKDFQNLIYENKYKKEKKEQSK